MSTITKVWLDETETECTMCGACELSCREVFDMPEKMAVRKDADYSMIKEIIEAVEGCPVGAIAIEYDGSGRRDNPA